MCIELCSMSRFMFPVYTGINRNEMLASAGIHSVPCIHRDKPRVDSVTPVAVMCSLYTQG